MHSLSTAQQKLKAVLEACGLPVALRQEWDTEYLSVPIVVDPEQNRQLSARFTLIEDGQPALTDLPRGRYLCICIPNFYGWWDDLNRFPQVLLKANNIAYSLRQRKARSDFFISYTENDRISFSLDVPLAAGEDLNCAVPALHREATAIAAGVYAYLRAFDETYTDEQQEAGR